MASPSLKPPPAPTPRIAEIAEIEDDATRAQTLFDYLKDWVPPDPPAIPDQAKTGLRYGIRSDGVMGYAKLPEIADPSQQQRQLHVLLVEDAAELVLTIGGDRDLSFAPIARKMERYAAGLGSSLHDMSPVLVWKAGNDIRLILRADGEKKRQLINEPTLGPDILAALEGFTATHNAFSALHPDLSALDNAKIDPAERHKAEQDRALLQSVIDAFAIQTRLILQEITEDLRDLHREAMGTSDAALRAMQIERDSIESLLKALTAQGILEARSDTFLSRVAGDVRSSVVGAAVGSAMTGAGAVLGPEIASSFPQLISTLQPQIAELLTALHGQGQSLAQAADWVAAKLRQALKK